MWLPRPVTRYLLRSIDGTAPRHSSMIRSHRADLRSFQARHMATAVGHDCADIDVASHWPAPDQ
jgi:hypothetical protein